MASKLDADPMLNQKLCGLIGLQGVYEARGTASAYYLTHDDKWILQTNNRVMLVHTARGDGMDEYAKAPFGQKAYIGTQIGMPSMTDDKDFYGEVLHGDDPRVLSRLSRQRSQPGGSRDGPALGKSVRVVMTRSEPFGSGAVLGRTHGRA